MQFLRHKDSKCLKNFGKKGLKIRKIITPFIIWFLNWDKTLYQVNCHNHNSYIVINPGPVIGFVLHNVSMGNWSSSSVLAITIQITILPSNSKRWQNQARNSNKPK